MPATQQLTKTKRTREAEPPAADVRARTAHVRTAEEREAADAELDAVLEDIDEVLTENAESFVRDYVQKGGE